MTKGIATGVFAIAATTAAIVAAEGTVIAYGWRRVGKEIAEEIVEEVVDQAKESLGIPDIDLKDIKDVVDAGKDVLKKKGREGAQEKLRELATDPKLGGSDKGWIKQEMRQIDQKKRRTIRNPPGKVLAHERGRESAKGYSYKHSNLQTKELHKLQHKHDKNGKLNKERPIK